MKKLLLASAIILWGLAPASQAVNYYVDANNGNNANAGTSAETAWKTLTYASTAAASGDKINAAQGMYDETSNGETFPLDFRANQHVVGANMNLVTIECNSLGHLYIVGLGAGATLESITQNTTQTDGLYVGLWFANSNCEIKSCKLLGTNASGKAANVVAGANMIRFYKCEIRGFSGGFNPAISIASDNVTIESCTIVKNSIGVNFNNADAATNVYVFNSIISAAPEGVATGTGLQNNGSGTLNASYNDVYNNTTNYDTCNGGVGAITVEAYFVSVTGNDYHLTATSECINAGNPASKYNDPDGTRADMGAYYYAQSVTPPAVTVTSPNGGEKWPGGSTHNISWTATAGTNPIAANGAAFSYSSNGGTSYTQIASGQSSTSPYSWTIPTSINTTEVKIKVQIEDTLGTIGSDESNAVFWVDSASPEVRVGQPNGGENILGGSTYNITWEATDNFTSQTNLKINLKYSTDEGTTWITIASTVSNEGGSGTAGTYAWTVPSVNTNLAKIRVEATDEAINLGFDISNTNFTIEASVPTTPTLIYPTNTSTNDATPTFSWNPSTATSGIASYEVRIDGGNTSTTTQGAITTFTPSANLTEGSHTWEVRAKSAAGQWGSYSTTGIVTVDVTAPIVQVGQPNGGESIAGGASYNITWEATDNLTPQSQIVINLKYSTNSGTSWAAIANGETNDGTYTWTAPDISSSSCRVSVEAQDLALNLGADMSNSNFTISGTTAAVSIIQPNGGEVIGAGTTYTISWTATNEIGINSINLLYSSNGGTSWSTIATGEVNDGSYSWTVPSISSTTARVSVEAVDILNRKGTNMSAANFTIISVSPTVAISAPSAGAGISGLNNTYTISYSATDAAGLAANPITLRYSTDGGANWTAIVASTTNTGTYNWTVPSANTSTARVSLEAINVADLKSAIATGNFTIDSVTPEVNSTSPSNGATGVEVNASIQFVFSEAMSREATQNAFSISSSVTGTTTWSADSTIMYFTPASNLSFSTAYTAAVSVAAKDFVGNALAQASSAAFTTKSSGDLKAPTAIVKVRDIAIKKGDYIPARPEFKSIISDEVAIDTNSIKMYIDNAAVAPTIAGSGTSVTATYTVLADLSNSQTHSIKVQAADLQGNTGTKEVTDLKVSDAIALIGPVLAYPEVLKPASGQTGKFAYTLTSDADVFIYLFGISGQMEYTARYLSGQNGGRAGYNEVAFEGKSQLTGGYLGNGMYVLKIIANNKEIGKGHVVIFD